MTFLQELVNLRACRVHAGQDGEDGLATFEDFLVQRVVGFVELYETGCAEDDHDGIDFVEVAFAVVDGNGQMLGVASSQDIDRVGDGRAWQ